VIGHWPDHHPLRHPIPRSDRVTILDNPGAGETIVHLNQAR